MVVSPAVRKSLVLALSVHVALVSKDAFAEPSEHAEQGVLVRGKIASGFVSEASTDTSPREVTDAASLIEPLPGVHVRRLGADDSFSTLSIRGTSSQQAMVILAGVPLTGGADPTLDLASLPLWPGTRVRVYRSFAPATLGVGSLGGTLAIDPPIATLHPRTEVWGQIGSYGVGRMRIGTVAPIASIYSANDATAAAAVSASRSDDNFPYEDPITQRTVVRTNAGHAALNGLFSLKWPVKWGDDALGAITLTTLAQARSQELPGPVLAPTPRARLGSQRLVSTLEATGPLARGTWSVRTWGRRDSLQLRNDLTTTPSVAGATHTDDAITAVGTALGYKRVFDRSAIETRIDGSMERFAPGSWQGAPQPPGATRAQSGVGLDASHRVTDAWRIQGAGRADLWSDSDTNASSITRARPAGHIGTEYTIGALTLASHGGGLARPPSFVERFGNRGGFIGERALRPERAWTVDVGARAKTNSRAAWLKGELVGFGTWAEDLIVFVNQGAYGQSKATNIGRARLLGVEAYAEAGAEDLTLRVSYTGLATSNLSECGSSLLQCERPSLPGRPTHDAVVDLAYAVGPLTFRYGVDVTSGIQADLTGAVQVPARALHNASVTFRVPESNGVAITADAKNIFDLRTASYAGATGPVDAPIGDLYAYPLPGRRFFLSVKDTFDETGALRPH